MNTKWYLVLAGAGSVILSILGFIHILGPSPQYSIFGQQWWLDGTQNFIHLIIGIGSIAAALFLTRPRQQGAVWLLGVISIVGAMLSVVFRHMLIINLTEPVEEVLYFTVGNLGLWTVTMEVNNEQRKDLEKLLSMATSAATPVQNPIK